MKVPTPGSWDSLDGAPAEELEGYLAADAADMPPGLTQPDAEVRTSARTEEDDVPETSLRTRQRMGRLLDSAISKATNTPRGTPLTPKRSSPRASPRSSPRVSPNQMRKGAATAAITLQNDEDFSA